MKEKIKIEYDKSNNHYNFFIGGILYSSIHLTGWEVLKSARKENRVSALKALSLRISRALHSEEISESELVTALNNFENLK